MISLTNTNANEVRTIFLLELKASAAEQVVLQEKCQDGAVVIPPFYEFVDEMRMGHDTVHRFVEKIRGRRFAVLKDDVC